MLFDRRGVISFCAMLAFAVFLLAGCGGKASPAGTSSTSASAGTSTVEAPTVTDPASKQFIAQADPICRSANTQLAASKGKGKGGAQLAAAVLANEAVEHKTLTELATLKPPAALAAAWSTMLGYRRVLANGLAKLAVVAKHEDQAQLPALASSKKKLHVELYEVAVKAGFKDCALLG